MRMEISAAPVPPVCPSPCPACGGAIALHAPPFLCELPCPQCRQPLVMIRTFHGPTFYPTPRARPIIDRALRALGLTSPSAFHDFVVHATLTEQLCATCDFEKEFGEYFDDPDDMVKVPGDYLDRLIRRFG